MSGHVDWVGDRLAALVAIVVRHPLLVIAATIVLAIPSGRYAMTHLGINTDTANMISPTLPWRRDFIEYRDEFPARDQNIVIAVDADDPEVAAEAAAALTSKLESEPALFERVFLAGHGDFFERNGLMYLPLTELESLSDRLVAAQPLIGRLTRHFSGAAVIDIAALAVGPDAGSVDAAAVGPLLDSIAATLDSSARDAVRPLDWRALIGTDTAQRAGRPLILVRPKLDFDRIQPAADAITAIRTAAAQLGTELDEPFSVRLSGTVAMEHEELVSVTRGAATAGVAALVMVVIVLIWALRSVLLLVLSVGTLLTGLVFTAAYAAVTVGHLNLISVAFAVLYVGLGVDFILHVILRLKELVAAGHDLRIAVVETARGVGASLVICAVTTAAGFFAFVPTDFDGVSELGLISGGGMFISLAISLTLLPALLVVCWRPGTTPVRTARLTIPGLPRLSSPRIARIVVAAFTVILLAALTALPRLQFDSNPIHLRDPESESVRLLAELAGTSDAPLFSLVAIADDPGDAERLADAVVDDPLVARVVTAGSLVPADQDDKEFVLEDLRFVLGNGFATVTPAPFDAGELLASLSRLDTALADTDPADPAAAGLAAALRRWFTQFDAAGEADGAERVAVLDAALRSDLPESLATLDEGLDAKPFGRADLPVAIAERWIADDGRELVEFVPAEDLNDNAASARFVAEIRNVAPHATGLPVVYLEASRTIVRAFVEALSLALVAVAILLLVMFRRLSETVLVLVPILCAATITAGLAVWFGLAFNFANVIALPLLIGVGVDNGIHIVHRMRTEPPSGSNPFATSTSRAVLASGLTTIASFGNLAFSEHVGTASMGQLLTIGMTVTLLATLVLLPALLTLRARR